MGYNDEWQGWYDLQQCGRCYDFCRWVGNDGSGGDPNVRLIYESSRWSCRRAGTDETYSPSGSLDHVTLWTKCTHEGADSPGNSFNSSSFI